MNTFGISTLQKIKYKNGNEDLALVVRKYVDIVGDECIVYLRPDGDVVHSEVHAVEDVFYDDYGLVENKL